MLRAVASGVTFPAGTPQLDPERAARGRCGSTGEVPRWQLNRDGIKPPTLLLLLRLREKRWELLQLLGGGSRSRPACSQELPSEEGQGKARALSASVSCRKGLWQKETSPQGSQSPREREHPGCPNGRLSWYPTLCNYREARAGDSQGTEPSFGV